MRVLIMSDTEEDFLLQTELDGIWTDHNKVLCDIYWKKTCKIWIWIYLQGGSEYQGSTKHPTVPGKASFLTNKCLNMQTSILWYIYIYAFELCS